MFSGCYWKRPLSSPPFHVFADESRVSPCHTRLSSLSLRDHCEGEPAHQNE